MELNINLYHELRKANFNVACFPVVLLDDLFMACTRLGLIGGGEYVLTPYPLLILHEHFTNKEFNQLFIKFACFCFFSQNFYCLFYRKRSFIRSICRS